MGQRVLVIGGRSIVGHFLLPRLTEIYEVHVLSRGAPPAATPSAVRWHLADIATGVPQLSIEIAHAVHLAPLWLLPPLLSQLAAQSLTRLVAFSSTSRFTKLASSNGSERRQAKALAEAEEAVAADSARLGVTWTVLRPTLTYGAGLDANVSQIARFIRSFSFFPIAGAASGRRQPVHADDLAQACIAALQRPSAANRAYNLSGGSTLTYREMVEAIFRGMGRSPRILSVPPKMLRAGLRLASLWPGVGELSPEMAGRMLEDLCFDHSEAGRDLDFRPRAFSYPGSS